ncbi:MAG: hypothetical protein J6V71_01680 [Clostridia bacterium]|nr:hypothetical protein [Clostridia bacterium]
MLKKCMVIFSSIVLIIAMFCIGNMPLFTNKSGSYEVYLENSSNSQSIINVNIRDFALIFNKKGESVYIENKGFELHNFLCEMKANLLFIEEIDGKVSYYAYSPKLKYMQRVKSHNVNLHVVVGESMVKVGSPIIYGSF